MRSNAQTFYDYLYQFNADVEDNYNRLIKQMAEREGIIEHLKAENQMEWIVRMNSIRLRDTEIVNS